MQEAFYHFTEAGHKEKVGDIGDRLSNYYYESSMYHTAFFYAGKAYELLGDETPGVIFNFLGLIYQLYGRNDRALGLYKKSLAGYKESGDKKAEGTTLNNISQIYDAQGDYETALNYLEQDLKSDRDIGDISGEAYTLFNMAMAYFEDDVNRLEEGLACLKQAAAINEQVKDAALAKALEPFIKR